MATLIAVDDDLGLLRLIRIALEKDGHRVLTFANPEAVGEDDWAQADLILLDVMMPQQSGFRAVSENSRPAELSDPISQRPQRGGNDD